MSMREHTGQAQPIHGGDTTRLESIIERFEQAWRSGEQPRVEDYVNDPAVERLTLLVELVHADLEYRLRAGQKARVEDYLQRFPELRKRSADLIKLIEAEYSHCRHLGQAPEMEQYFGRFPDLGSTLRDRLAERAERTTPYEGSNSLSGEFPQQLGRYRLKEEIGRGGMGVVLRVSDSDFDRTLAVKVMLDKYRNDADAERRFLDEAKITGRLQHPGIPPVHDLGRMDDGRAFFAMKLIRGETLASLLKNRVGCVERTDTARTDVDDGAFYAPYDLPRLIGIFEQICQTLASAHSQGIIHRDLKPANVMVGAFGEVQVMDWGLAKVVSGPWSVVSGSEETKPIVIENSVAAPEDPIPSAEPRSTDHGPRTNEGVAMGTPAYMAPEQARGEIGEVDQRADVFGLGAILCVILTGRPPFRSINRDDVFAMARRGDVADAFERLSGVGADAELIELCKKCLAAEKEQRPQDAGEVAKGVASYQQAVQEKLRQAELGRAQAEVQAVEERKRWRVERHRSRLLTALAAAVLLLVAGASIAGLLYQNYLATETQRELEATRDLALAEKDVEQAVTQGETTRKKLYDQLTNKGGVFELLNQPLHWRGQIADARAALERAKSLAKRAAKGQVKKDLLHRIQQLDEQLRSDDEDCNLAEELEDVRSNRSMIVGKKFNNEYALREYPLIFERIGIRENEKVDEGVVASLSQSPIREQLAAALDDWAIVALVARFEYLERLPQSPPQAYLNASRKKRERLWELARRIDNDVWRNRLRNPEIWRAPGALENLANQLRKDRTTFEKLSPQTLYVVGILVDMRGENSKKWSYEAQKLHPNDFWLNNQLAKILHKHSPGKAARYYQAALAIRPNHSGAWVNLGWALADQKDYANAEACYRKAIELNPKLAVAWNNIGVNYVEQNDFERAIPYYQKAIKFDPKAAYVWPNLGYAQFRLNNFSAAVSAYKKSVELKPKNAKNWDSLATALTKQGKFVDGIAAFQQSLKLDPKRASTWYNLGICYFQHGNIPAAVDAYEKAVKVDPKDGKSWNNLGFVLQQQKKFQPAIDAYKSALSIDPRDAGAWTNLGSVYTDMNDFANAVAAQRKAIEINPKLTEAWHNLGNVHFVKKDYVAAASAYRKAVEINPRFAKAWVNLGSALVEQKNPADAVPIFQKALKIKPQMALGWTNLGCALIDIKKYSDAIAALRKAVHFDPQIADAWRNLGLALLHKKNHPEAIDAYRKGLKIAPQHSHAWSNLGTALLQQENAPAALAAFKESLKIDNKNSGAWNNLGLLYLMQDDFANAAIAYKKLLAIEPGDAQAWNNLGSALVRQGKFKEGMAAYKKALNIAPKLPQANLNIGLLHRDQGDFALAIAALQKGVESLPVNDTNRVVLRNLVEQIRKLQALEKRLPVILQNKGTTAAERRVATDMCRRYLQRYRDAVKLYSDAFAADGSLAARYPNRYIAASCAVLAAAGKGRHATEINAQEKAKLRRQALAWLRADLDLFKKKLQGNPTWAVTIHDQLLQWRQNGELAGVRDAKAQARMPDADRQAWQKLWSDVSALKKQARGSYAETVVKGTLSSAKRQQTHVVQLQQGTTYVFEMRSSQFDTFLGLQDANAKLLKQNDDIDTSRKILDSRITFTPKTTAVYRLIATSYQRQGAGAYEIVIRDFSGRKGTVVVKNTLPKKDKPKKRPVKKTRPEQGGPNDIAGTLTAEDPLDTFPLTKQSRRRVHDVTLDAGKTYHLTLEGKFDTFLRVEDSAKNALLYNDDVTPPANLNSSLIFRPAKRDNYRVIVTSFKLDTGAYSLKIREAKPFGQPTVIKGELTKDDKQLQGKHFKLHKVELMAGRSYTIEMEGKFLDTYLVLIDPTGKRGLADNDDIVPDNTRLSRIDFTPATTNTYVILATSFGAGQTGNYTVRVQGYQSK